MTSDVRRQIFRMAGELFREVGVLVGVFAPLEMLVSYGTLTAKEMVAIVVLAGPCLALGMYLGLER